VQYTVRVEPGSRKGPLVETSDDDGLVRALAGRFGTVPRSMRIVRGHTSRVKRVEVDE